jgi:hypothetical protein
MTIQEVQRRLEEIRAVAHDDEMAHSSEDSLHQDVLTAIASGSCVDPAACAKAALTSNDILFSRWCA